MNAAVQRQSLSDQTARAIRANILNERYQLGQKLREADMAAEFGVSHSVIREALHVLQGEGVVVTKPYCGRSVFSVTAAEARELVVMRASLESYAAFLAAEKLTSESKARITSEARNMNSSLPQNYADWVDRELSFHRAIWEASNNDYLCRQLGQISLPMYAMAVLRVSDVDFDLSDICSTTSRWEASNSIRGHQLLAQAVLNGNPQQAREAMLLHIMGAPSFVELRKKIFQI